MAKYPRPKLFKPKNPQKYKGNHTNIVARSSWEYRLMIELDIHPDVLEWASEEPWFSVSYRHPLDKKLHRYFPDFWVKRKTKDGTLKTSLIEVKPQNQSVPPPMRKNGTNDKRYAQRALTYAINEAKWESANKYCSMKGWEFKVLTENEILNVR